MNRLKRYLFTAVLRRDLLKEGRTELPVEIIAITPEGMFAEAQDVWAALDYTSVPEFSETAAVEFESRLFTMFPQFTSVRIRRTSAPGIHKGHLTQVFLRGNAFPKACALYFTWENIPARPLSAADVDCLSFGGIVDLVDFQFPDEFIWNTETYIGKHVTLPVSIYARGSSIGITKVHVDAPGEPQQVFRGDPVRILDLVVQAKANCQPKGHV